MLISRCSFWCVRNDELSRPEKKAFNLHLRSPSSSPLPESLVKMMNSVAKCWGCWGWTASGYKVKIENSLWSKKKNVVISEWFSTWACRVFVIMLYHSTRSCIQQTPCHVIEAHRHPFVASVSDEGSPSFRNLPLQAHVSCLPYRI